VAGFFGSGKSHLIKILSYVLANAPHTHSGETKRAVEFFTAKIPDPLTLADIQKAAASDTDVILFNIDSRADVRGGRDAILSVFLKVLNELAGYCPEHAHIAHMERYLDEKGKLDTFRAEFERLTGQSWEAERDAYAFNRDEVVQAFSKATGQSQASAEKWVDSAESSFTLSVESFSKNVKDYLDKQGKNRRVVFLVDEVGAFIGRDGGLMLNLQTIVENLGTVCQGRAWVVVTAQEELDKILGDMPKTAQNDFSKIQGRFKTPGAAARQGRRPGRLPLARRHLRRLRRHPQKPAQLRPVRDDLPAVYGLRRLRPHLSLRPLPVQAPAEGFAARGPRA